MISLWFLFTFPWWLVMMNIYLFMCLLSSLEKHLYRSFAHFLSQIVSLILNFIGSLYILDINPFSNVYLLQFIRQPFVLFPLLCKSFLVWCSPICLFSLLLILCVNMASPWCSTVRSNTRWNVAVKVFFRCEYLNRQTLSKVHSPLWLWEPHPVGGFKRTIWGPQKRKEFCIKTAFNSSCNTHSCQNFQPAGLSCRL